jgi:peptidoglycan hydrolase-like protein with peptidoglycan-binding domain
MTTATPTTTASSDSAELTRAIQRELKARGYDTGAVDGVPSLVTRAAIMAFEADHGLALTAEPRQDLLRAIVLGSGGETLTPGEAATEPGPQAVLVIRAVQQALQGLGYRTGAADGRLGTETVTAIRRFEAAQGMKESGRISGPLVARLALAGGAGLTSARP